MFTLKKSNQFSNIVYSTIVSLITVLIALQTVYAAKNDPIIFLDQPLTERLIHPDWFNLSFLNLPEDLADANKNKRGLIIYYSQGYCPYCKAFIKNNWEKPDIVAFTQKHFDVTAIDVLSAHKLTGLDNKKYTSKDYANFRKTNFTPSLEFYDNKGKLALRFNGYRPPYQFRAALEFVADGHHRRENFKSYLSRAEAAMNFGSAELNHNTIFEKPPYDLTQKLVNYQQHTLVIYERIKCHSCDVLHAGPLKSNNIKKLFKHFKIIQLDINSSTDVTNNEGYKLTAESWANKLELDYAPTLLFYDANGKEIMRVDSVVGFFRLQGILEYIASKSYIKYPTFQLWRQRI